ncbi:hypothetical protein CNM00490 [Cryptococcus deneoformans JEC21]|uniref:Uncharacterized protein n=1 Tax=Cryptococcus deneoformans (strain JEC21 / ATCC MYA-565) TaxID=214684 RepID=Q5K812_CRYD1|nr:hypothetical protein CNM00490 [Cryptococcus neoformans var. neoformans JEC21]AAW46837.1 hypothetical protein CNM00490 [Cryptococcus neoformans var. neoformans JEC21]
MTKTQMIRTTRMNSSGKLQEVMEEFCDLHKISLTALERRLAETKQTRAMSTWILWQRSNIAKRLLEALENDQSLTSDKAASVASINEDNFTSTFQRISKKKDFSSKEDEKTQALVTRVKRNSALYKAQKERLGDVELRRRLEEDVYGEQQLAARDTALSVSEREKKIKAMKNETWKWMHVMEA